jgi:hypothetical protein
MAEEKGEEEKTERIQILSEAGVFHAFAWGSLENINCSSGFLHLEGSGILFHHRMGLWSKKRCKIGRLSNRDLKGPSVPFCFTSFLLFPLEQSP